MRTRAIVVALLGIIFLGLLLSSNTYFPELPRKAYATTQSITLNGSAGTGWNSTTPNGPAITVAEFDSVIATLTSIDSVQHQFCVDRCSAYFGGPSQNPIRYAFNVTLPAGNYTYYCSIHPWMIGPFIVKGFRAYSAPNSITLLRGSSARFTIVLTSVNGFSGNASLTANSSAGLVTSLNSSSVLLASGKTSAVTFTIDAPSTMVAGIYNTLVNATIGSISHTTSVTVVVKKPGFSLSSYPTRLAIFQGSSKTANVTLTSLNTFNGTVSLSVSPQYPGITTAFAPPNVTVNKGQPPATTVLNVTIASSVISNEYILTLTGTSGPDTNTTNVKLVVGQDFNITASPLNLTIPQGSLGNSRIVLSSVFGFEGNVSLSSMSTPVGLSVLLNVTSVNLQTNQTAYASATILASQLVAPKVYDVKVTGTNNSRVRSVNIIVTVSGFTIQPSTASLNLIQGASKSFTITSTSINDFAGMMNLTVKGSAALTRSLTPSIALLNANASLTATLTLSANSSTGLTPPAAYTFNVTGTVGSLSHSTTVTVTVTAMPSIPKSPESFPIVLVVGSVVPLVALLSITLFFVKRRRLKGKSPSVPPSN